MATRKRAAPPRRSRVDKSVLFGLCRTPQELKNWILAFLGLELPDCVVDADSTSSPFDFVWEVYKLAMDGQEGVQQQVSEIMGYAGRTSFKCVERGTRLLLKDGGLIPIEDVKIGDVCWSGRSWRAITHWIDDGEKEAVQLTLANGLRLTTSPVHRVWAWSPGNMPDWKRVSELQSDDLVQIDLKHGWGQDFDATEYDSGYLCGVLQGDGCLTLLDRYNRATLTTADSNVLQFWQTFAARYGKVPAQSASRPYDWTVCGRAFCNVLRDLGLTSSYSFEKQVPEACYRNRSRMLGFLAGLFDTDGSVTSKNSLLWAITSLELLRGCQKLLLALGVHSTLRSNRLYPEHGQRHAVHLLEVLSNDVPVLMEAGFKISAAKAKVWKSQVRNDTSDTIPVEHLTPLLDALPKQKTNSRGILKPRIKHYPGLTRDKLRRVLDWAVRVEGLTYSKQEEWLDIASHRWVKVAVVQNATAHFFDISVEGDHSYWSDGLVSHNTLLAAVLEVLMVFHHHRDVVHLAAIEKQSLRAQGYVRKFLERPALRDYLEGGDNNRRTLGIHWYEGQGQYLTPSEYLGLTESQRDSYEHQSFEIQVVVCTPSGVQGPHAQFMCVDEVDVIASPQSYQDAKMIPDERSDRNQLPITIYISTRKSGFGLVQKEIDDAPKTGMELRHWNIIDVTRACPPERHKPELSRLPIFVDPKQLTAIGEKAFLAIPTDRQGGFERMEGYDGCLTNCRLFAACKGRLVDHQKSTASTLKSVNATQLAFQRLGGDPDTASSQLLSRKPTSEGRIYPRLDPDVHVISAEEFLAKVSEHRGPTSRATLIRILVEELGARWSVGIDWGYSHNFSVTVSLVLKPYNLTVDFFESAGLETQQRIALCDERGVKETEADIWADPADPTSIAAFRSAGYRMRRWGKKPGSVMGGIQIARGKMRPILSEPEAYFLAESEGAVKLFGQLTKYHFTKDAQGNWTDVPDEEGDDGPDSYRYQVMNEFPVINGTFIVGQPEAPEPAPPPPAAESTVDVHARWFQEMMGNVGIRHQVVARVIKKGKMTLLC